MKRSAKYWGAFRRSADLQAIDTKTGAKVWKTGRGTHLSELAYKSLKAGVWKDVQVKAFNAKAWMPFADVPYTPSQDILHRSSKGSVSAITVDASNTIDSYTPTECT